MLPFLANVTFYLDLLHLCLPLPITHFPLPPCWGSEQSHVPSPLALTPLNMEECITGGLVVCWELKKPQEDTGNSRVTIGSGCKC